MSVGVYELFTLAAMLTIAVGALRGSSAWPRWLGLPNLAFAARSVILIGRTDGDYVGMWQRIWIANNLAWLLVVAGLATLRDPAAESGAGRPRML